MIRFTDVWRYARDAVARGLSAKEGGLSGRGGPHD